MSEVNPSLEEVSEEVLRREGGQWRRARTGCPDPDLLLESHSELLEPDVRDALREHVRSCAACARLSADLDAMNLSSPNPAVEAAVLARVRRGGSSSQFWRVPLAAALVLGCGAAAAWWMRVPSGPAPTAPSARPSATTATASMPVAMWTIEALPVRVPMSSVGVSRSGTAGVDASAALVDALAPYQAGRYAEAIPALQAVAGAHPESGEAALYLGVACLLADRPRDALAPLERAAALVDAPRRPEIDWYRATAEQRVGQLTAARGRLHTLCAVAGEYQQRACAAEQALR